MRYTLLVTVLVVGVGISELVSSDIKTELLSRLDLGIQINTMKFNAYTVVHRRVESIFGNEEGTYFYYDVGSDTHVDPYLNLTWNTAHRDWLLIFL